MIKHNSYLELMKKTPQVYLEYFGVKKQDRQISDLYCTRGVIVFIWPALKCHESSYNV